VQVLRLGTDAEEEHLGGDQIGVGPHALVLRDAQLIDEWQQRQRTIVAADGQHVDVVGELHRRAQDCRERGVALLDAVLHQRLQALDHLLGQRDDAVALHDACGSIDQMQLDDRLLQELAVVGVLEMLLDEPARPRQARFDLGLDPLQAHCWTGAKRRHQ